MQGLKLKGRDASEPGQNKNEYTTGQTLRLTKPLLSFDHIVVTWSFRPMHVVARFRCSKPLPLSYDCGGCHASNFFQLRGFSAFQMPLGA
jgi:hypothetical protein